MKDPLTFNSHDYKHLYKQLKTMEDVNRLSTDYPEDLLFVIYTQRTVREVKKRFHHMARQSSAFRRWWKHGDSFVKISRKIEFPPVLTAMLILKLEGVGRKTYRNYLHEPDKAPTKRLRRELKEAIEVDNLYSPRGHEIQRERGVMAEEKLAEWLHGLGLTYRREADLRKEFAKTPDFLLDRSFWVRDTEIKWVESKASFGDHTEIRTNLKKQLEPYRELFGSGMVIYWYGIVPYGATDDILIETRAISEPSCADLVSVASRGEGRSH